MPINHNPTRRKTVAELDALVPGDVSQSDQLLVWNGEDGTTRKLSVQDLQDSPLVNGYYFQNSWYFENGRTHDGNPDVLTELEAESVTPILFTCDEEGDFGNFLPVGTPDLYDRATGLLTFDGYKESDFIQIRTQLDCVPEQDNGQLMIHLEVQRPGRSPFNVSEIIMTMDQGADREYNGLSTIPIFIGSMADADLGPSTIEFKVELINTPGDVKPRGFALYTWR